MEKKTSTILREPAVRRDAANLERPLGRSLLWREILHLFHVTSYFLPPRSTTCARYQDISNQKQTGVLPRKDPPLAGVITPSTFCEFYLQPVYRAASARFQQVLFFSFPGRYFERPSFFSLMRASIFRCYDCGLDLSRSMPNRVPD
jgi:hypothetical protein